MVSRGVQKTALGEHFFSFAKAEREAMIQPDRMAYDLWGKAMISIQTCGTGEHASITACRVTAVQGPR